MRFGRRRERAREAIEPKDGARVARRVEVSKAGEDAECAGKRQVQLTKADGYFTRKHRAGGRAVERDIARLILLQ